MATEDCTKPTPANGTRGCEYSRTNRVLSAETDRRIGQMERLIETIMEKLDRPPVWATVAIAGLSGTIGVLATIIAGFISR